MTASATGSIIKAVAAFEIHIDKNAVAAITPSTIRWLSAPIRFKMCKAIRL